MSDSFDVSKYVNKIGGKDYVNVRGRLQLFHQAYPHDGAERHPHIEQKIIAANETWACVHTRITITDNDGRVLATSDGIAQEFHKDFADHVEKAATASLGRAFAGIGFGTDDLFDEGMIGGQVAIVDSPRGGAQSPTPIRASASVLPPSDRTPRVTHGAGDPASPKQFGFLKATARERGISDEDLAAQSWHLFEKVIADLTKREMSTFIDTIQGKNPSYPEGVAAFSGNNDDTGREPGYSLSSPASEAATGMSSGASRYWTSRVENMNTSDGVDKLLDDAVARFADRLSDEFLDAVARRRGELAGQGL